MRDFFLEGGCTIFSPEDCVLLLECVLCVVRKLPRMTKFEFFCSRNSTLERMKQGDTKDHIRSINYAKKDWNKIVCGWNIDKKTCDTY